MLDYKLCKELKDAGFPQYLKIDRLGYYIKDGEFGYITINFNGLPGRDNPIYVPTLSELIEACGDDFYKLERWNSRGFNAKGFIRENGEIDELAVCAESSEEAVAKLWLELKKINYGH